MTDKKIELNEMALEKINGGFYFDYEKGIVGFTASGPFYKFKNRKAVEFFLQSVKDKTPDDLTPAMNKRGDDLLEMLIRFHHVEQI